MKIYGNHTALVTPFKKNQSIDYSKLKNLVEYQVKNKTNGIVALGSTAEAPTLTEFEKHKVTEIIKNNVPSTLPIIAGINAFSLTSAIEQAHNRFIDGANALLVAPPPYIKPSYKGLESYFLHVADYSYIPIVLYNIPSRTGSLIPIELIKKLSKHPNIIGIKEASGDLLYATKISQYISKDFTLIAGNDNLLLPLLSINAEAVISVIGNIYPLLYTQIIDYFKQNNPQQASSLFFKHFDLIEYLSLESNPIPIKYLLSKLNLLDPYWRQPLCPPSAKNKRTMNLILNSIKIS